VPTVPKYGDRKVGQDALPGARQTGPGGVADTPLSEGAATGAALSDLGQTGQRLAYEASELQHRHAQQELERKHQLFELSATRRANESLDRALRDPATGVLNARGIDVMPAIDRARVAWDNDMGALATDAKDDDERAVAMNLTNAYTARFRDAVSSHQHAELTEYDNNEFKGLQASAENVVTAAALTSTATVLATIGDAQDAAQKFATRNGMGPEATKALVDESNNKLAFAAVSQALTKGNPVLAAAFLDQFAPSRTNGGDTSKDILTGAARQKLEEAVQRGLTLDTAETLSSAIWSELGPKSDEDAISLDTMEDKARAQTKGDPELLNAVRTALRTRKQAVDDGRRERLSSAQEKLWGAARDGVPYTQISLTREAIDHPREALQVRDYLQALTDKGEARHEAELQDNAWPEYYRLSQPEELAKMTSGEAASKLKVLGHTLTNRLIGDLEQFQRARAAGEKALQKTISDAKMDHQDLLQEAERSGFDYAFNPVNKQQRATIAQLQAAANDEVRRATEAKGGALTRDEQVAAFRRVLDKKVTIDRWFGDASMPTAVVNPDDAPKAYVPFDDIPWKHKNELLNLLRSQNPAFVKLTDAELRKRSGVDEAIGRAYAAYQLGLGDEAMMARLREAAH
jgi:hypothetical protein